MRVEEILQISGVSRKEDGCVSRFYRSGRPLVELGASGDSLPEKIFELLSHQSIRRGKSDLYDQTRKDYLKKMDFFTDHNLPLEFVFCGFPFKCHNPIETVRRTPDLGELSFLLRLMDIDATVRQIYPPGVKFTVLTEGNAYQDFFGATSEEIQSFNKRIDRLVKDLNAEEKIDFIDFLSVCQQSSDFKKQCSEEEEGLQEKQEEEAVHRKIKALIPVMIRSLPIVENVPLDDLFQVYDYGLSSQNLSGFQREFRDYLLEGAKDLTIRYLAFQRAKTKLDVIRQAFSQKLYVSIVPKPSHYSFHPIHRRTRLFPHHGVPVLGSDRVDIVFFKEVVQNPDIYVAVFSDDDIEQAPFYFLKGKQHLKMLK